MRPDSENALYRQAIAAKQAGHYEDAIALFKKIDNPAAQFNIALFYAYGHGVPADDRHAVELLTHAAEAGNPTAQTELGNRYATGRGVPDDPAAAVAWYRKAADQGYVWAEVLLGLAYVTGHGVTQNLVDADSWFVVAAAAGDVTAGDQRDTLESFLTEDERLQATERANTIAERLLGRRQP